MKMRGLGKTAAFVLLLTVCTWYIRAGHSVGVPAAEVQDSVPSVRNADLLELPFMAGDNIVWHKAFNLSYNSEDLIPDWVAYELLASELEGDVPRQKGFCPDPLVKGRQACDSDYTASGYDRGHMAPAADMKFDETAMRESFFLSNVCPQNHNLNSGVWNDLEMQVRNEARYYGRVWVVAGPYTGSAKYGSIGRNGVRVPDAFFKALLTVDREGNYRSVAFLFPNEAGRRKLSEYAMSVNELEELTGIDFFYNLDPAVQEQVEDVYDCWNDWRIR